MPGLDSLKKRLEFRGGSRQIDRMMDDKVRSLNKALLYSYQSATAVLSDGREFRCLINPNKLSLELDDKMLSIPFRDICLNKERPDGETTTAGKENIGVKCGDTIEWKENGTHWLVYSQYLQETAYFRGLMRQCSDEAIDINGKKFWYYLKGPDDKTIDWQKTKNLIFNDLSYELEIYISNTIETNEFFQRFKKIKIREKYFEIQAVDDLSINNILIVYLKESYRNEWAPKDSIEEMQPEEPIEGSYIQGPAQVYPYDIISYKAINISGGQWSLSNKRAIIKSYTDTSVEVEITTGRSGDVSLLYFVGDAEPLIFNIQIQSL